MEALQSGAGGSRRTHLSGARLAALALAAVIVALMLAASAQAYVPGRLVWARTSGTAAHERGFSAIAKAPNGQFYGAGWVETSAAKGEDVLVVKFDAAGRVLWTRTWDGGGAAADDWAQSATSDAKGNVYVIGLAGGATSSDIVTIKYSAAGKRQWVARWAGDGGSSDDPRAIAVDAQGNVVVAGARYSGPGITGIVVVKYDAYGVEQWVQHREPDPADPQDGGKWPADLALDAAGDVYVTGYSYHDTIGQAVTFKLASADGAELHKATYDAAAGSYASAIAVRGQAVVITGSAAQTASQEDVLVVKYDLALVEQYRLEYADPRGTQARDWGNDVAIGANGNAYVAGYSNCPPPSGYGYYNSALVLKVSDNGSMALWARRYKPSGTGASTDLLILDGSDNLYAAGEIDTDASEENMLVMKYSAAGTRKWVRSWHGTGKDDDWPGGLAFGSSKALYVAGGGTAKGGTYRAVALRINR